MPAPRTCAAGATRGRSPLGLRPARRRSDRAGARSRAGIDRSGPSSPIRGPDRTRLKHSEQLMWSSSRMTALDQSLQTPAYEAVAPAYDLLTTGYAYDRWSREIEALASEHGLRGRRL